MKKLSLLFLSILSALFFVSSTLTAQEDATEAAKEKANKLYDEHATTEDATLENVDKVYENETIAKLKGQARSYTDGFNVYVNDKVKFELSDIDNIKDDTIFYKIDEGEDQQYTEPFSIEEEGKHTIYYYSVDKMGNKEKVKILNVIVDNTPPEVMLTIAAPFAKKDDVIYASDEFTYQYSISAKDNIVGIANVEYAADNNPAKEYVAPFSISSGKPVKINVAAEDRVGNLTKKYATKIIDENGNTLSESLEEINIVVDKTVPKVAIQADKEFYKKGNLDVASKDYKYTITADDAESGVKAIYYRIDSKSDFILYTGEITFSTNGLHKIEAIAKDAVGNTSETAVLDVYVDVIPADTQIKMLAN